MELQSLSHAAAMYQRDPRQIEHGVLVVQAEAALAAKLPIPKAAAPALTLNGLKYFSADEIAKAIVWLKKHDAEEIHGNG
jgi:hypothetical protein